MKEKRLKNEPVKKLLIKYLVVMLIGIGTALIGMFGIGAMFALGIYENLNSLKDFPTSFLAGFAVVGGVIIGGLLFGPIGLKTAFLLLYRLNVITAAELLDELRIILPSDLQASRNPPTANH